MVSKGNGLSVCFLQKLFSIYFFLRLIVVVCSFSRAKYTNSLMTRHTGPVMAYHSLRSPLPQPHSDSEC